MSGSDLGKAIGEILGGLFMSVLAMLILGAGAIALARYTGIGSLWFFFAYFGVFFTAAEIIGSAVERRRKKASDA